MTTTSPIVSTRHLRWLVAAIVLLTAVATPALAVEVESALFALITHKGGFASGRAHDHLIAAGDPTIELTWAGSLSDAELSLETLATDLVVDADPMRAESYPRLEELGILDEPFAELSDKDRAKIRDSMLSKKQLHADSHPEISVSATVLQTEESELGGVAFSHAGRLTLTAHGQSVERPFIARAEATEGGATLIEAVAEASFTDLGIEPFSAFLGAVKNLDGFHLYVRLVVRD